MSPQTRENLSSESVALTDDRLMPQHTHTVRMSTTHNSRVRNCTNGSDYTLADPGSGTTAAANNWTVDIQNFGGEAFQVTNMRIHFPSTAGTLTNPTATLNNPFHYEDQEVSGMNLLVSGSGSATVSDETLQPFVTAFMYRRVG